LTLSADCRSDSEAPAGGRRPRVVLTDHPWPSLELETSIFDAAGLELVAGPETAGSSTDVEQLVRSADPVAIVTCWADVSADAIAVPSDLAIVARLGVGLDNIAVDAATARNAWVTNVPDYCVGEVSDHAIGLLLAHFRGIARLDAATKRSGWRPDGGGLERVADLTVGIIGYGRIGRETGRKLHAFGCRVLGLSRGKSIGDDWSQPSDLAQIQAEADVIVIHAPLTAETTGMIDQAFLSACQRKPLLINVSRGPLVDNDALRHALDTGLLRGAALDVIDGEPSPPADLLARPDVIATPHIAFASAASLVELRRRACEEVVRVVKGEAPRNPCNEVMVGVPLDGGVASDIRVIDGPNGKEVVKKALAKLRVAADWFSDPARSATEVAAIDAFAELLGPGHVPEILWTKPDQNVFAMRLIDPRLRNWKQDLLQGHADAATAQAAGALLGKVHKGSSEHEAIRHRFADQTYFHELRIEPFFLRVAERMPAYGDAIRAVVDDMSERRTALVHGDFSPKNILADGSDVVILDFEVAHWGDPRFDVGFCLSHLVLKAMREQASRQAFQALIQSFLSGYRGTGLPILDLDLIKVTGCLMLARIEGSSPVDYLADLDRSEVLALATSMIVADAKPFDHFLNFPLELA
jgi:phosphoglycerate dehydrogenase-like enzyme/aminoglycoside phosphotransferase (APT) family kinase protein